MKTRLPKCNMACKCHELSLHVHRWKIRFQWLICVILTFTRMTWGSLMNHSNQSLMYTVYNTIIYIYNIQYIVYIIYVHWKLCIYSLITNLMSHRRCPEIMICTPFLASRRRRPRRSWHASENINTKHRTRQSETTGGWCSSTDGDSTVWQMVVAVADIFADICSIDFCVGSVEVVWKIMRFQVALV